ncbi:MAG: DUF1292 domain-containing protein [Angelakisella sp.]
MEKHEEERDVINLLDEEGQEHEFEIVDAVELEDQQYLALVPIFDQPEDSLEDDGQLVILRVSDENDEDGEQFLEAIEDEDEYQRVAQLFMERLEDEFDFEDEDEEVPGADEV